ncbi:hypothetical protein PFISCL1PPCAC_15477, partial [Pristionchus fissidentatus]
LVGGDVPKSERGESSGGFLQPIDLEDGVPDISLRDALGHVDDELDVLLGRTVDRAPRCDGNRRPPARVPHIGPLAGL